MCKLQNNNIINFINYDSRMCFFFVVDHRPCSIFSRTIKLVPAPHTKKSSCEKLRKIVYINQMLMSSLKRSTYWAIEEQLILNIEQINRRKIDKRLH